MFTCTMCMKIDCLCSDESKTFFFKLLNLKVFWEKFMKNRLCLFDIRNFHLNQNNEKLYSVYL